MDDESQALLKKKSQLFSSTKSKIGSIVYKGRMKATENNVVNVKQPATIERHSDSQPCGSRPTVARHVRFKSVISDDEKYDQERIPRDHPAGTTSTLIPDAETAQPGSSSLNRGGGNGTSQVTPLSGTERHIDPPFRRPQAKITRKSIKTISVESSSDAELGDSESEERIKTTDPGSRKNLRPGLNLVKPHARVNQQSAIRTAFPTYQAVQNRRLIFTPQTSPVNHPQQQASSAAGQQTESAAPSSTSLGTQSSTAANNQNQPGAFVISDSTHSAVYGPAGAASAVAFGGNNVDPRVYFVGPDTTDQNTDVLLRSRPQTPPPPSPPKQTLPPSPILHPKVTVRNRASTLYDPHLSVRNGELGHHPRPYIVRGPTYSYDRVELPGTSTNSPRTRIASLLSQPSGLSTKNWSQQSKPLPFVSSAYFDSPLSAAPLTLPVKQLGSARPADTESETYFTSLNRVKKAYMANHLANNSLKRKHDLISTSTNTIGAEPPTSYIHERADDPEFNVFSSLLLYPELVFHFAALLPVETLISLYAISKDFHAIVDRRFTTVIIGQVVRKCSLSGTIFNFRSYAHLCRSDPEGRVPHPNPTIAAQGLVRKVPSFKWLRMVLHRERVVHEIMRLFAEAGVPLPLRCEISIKKIWYMLDLPDNARRIGFIHNQLMVSNIELYFMMCFVVKLEMIGNDPVGLRKWDGLKRWLLSQRSLTFMADVLRGTKCASKFDLLIEQLKWKCELTEAERNDPELLRKGTVFGVPITQIGKLKYEYWGLKHQDRLAPLTGVRFLLRPDQMIMRECVRRNLRFNKHFLKCLMAGYVDLQSLEDFAPRDTGRRIEHLKDEEYGIDDAIGGVSALGIGDEDEGYDELLDLGPRRQGSALTAKPETTATNDQMFRKNQHHLIEQIMHEYEEEKRQREAGN